MADAFGPVETVVFPRLGVELVDVRTLPSATASGIRMLWHQGMQEFLKENDTFGFQETCINQEACLGPLLNAYVDHVESTRRAGRRPQTFEDFGQANFERVGIPDFISKPWLPLHWWGIRPIAGRNFTGALLISNIQQVKMDSRLLTLRGWPVVVHPPIVTNRVTVASAAVAGAIARLVMDTDLVTIDARELDVDFVEWELPTHPDSRYVARGTNTYGRDVFEEMADGVKVRFGDETVENAPREIKRELQSEDDGTRYEDYTRPTRTVSAEPIRRR